MRKIENITNVLKFYMAVNKLKETTKGESSRADNIFGSSILAIAFNSEFNNASNLANIIKMELLYELSYTPDFFDVIKCMNSKEEIEELLLEFQACKSPDASLAHKYKSLDTTLSNIAKNTKSIDEFVDKALVVISMDKDKEKYINILKFYYYNHTLKSKLRTGWDKEHWNIESGNERVEMISDHIIGAVGLAYAFGSEFKYDFDVNEALKTLMINEGLATTAFDVWYLYDKNIYECNNDMKEFFDVLKCAKDNELLNLNKTIVETIDLSEQEYELLLSEISFEIARLKKNRWVEAITISFQQNEGKGVIVVKSACTELVSKEYFKSLTAYFEAKNLTKIKVEFTSRFVAVRPSYFKTPNVPREEKQSTIVFDRNGFLKNNQIVGFYDFDNQKNNYKVNYNPNIERELKLLQS